MSIEVPKNLSIYVVVAIVTGGGLFYSSSNVGITDDKVEALEDRIDRLELENKELRLTQSNHDALFAHAGIHALTQEQGKQIQDNQAAIQWVERCVFTGPCLDS